MHPSRGQLRIIGGCFRGRRLSIPDQPGLRPTPDRVRETLFNWLAPLIRGARCLDAFAGSGALGFEALSRGAGEVVLIERSRVVAQQLLTNATKLGDTALTILCADTLRWLDGTARPFDLVFLDPPFAEGLLSPAIERLARPGWLAPQGRVYLEVSAQTGFPPLPAGWELIRDQTAGQVRYGLVAVTNHGGSDAG